MRFQTTIRRTSTVRPEARLKQTQGIFDLPPGEAQELKWKIDVTLPEKWHIGAIIGESGSGKTTIARELAGKVGFRVIEGKDADGNLIEPFVWDRDRAVCAHTDLPIADWTGLLSRVGFSSPPAWCRPYQVLSNGQQFRCNLARAIAETHRGDAEDAEKKAKSGNPAPVFFDEFASLVHDQVASAAVAKAVRGMGGRFVAVT